MNFHYWSGWPGAFCLKCGEENLLDLAIAEGVYDPHLDIWTSAEDKEYYTPGLCPLSDAEYRGRLIELGQPVPEWAEELWTEERDYE